MKLIVLSLPRDASEENVAEIFQNFGKVKSCKLVLNDYKSSKGFAFVDMENEDEAQKAIQELHGSRLGKQKIRVKPAE